MQGPTSHHRKKALLIGINYYGTERELKGCLNDVNNMFAFLSANGFHRQDILTLTDNPRLAQLSLDPYHSRAVLPEGEEEAQSSSGEESEGEEEGERSRAGGKEDKKQKKEKKEKKEKKDKKEKKGDKKEKKEKKEKKGKKKPTALQSMMEMSGGPSGGYTQQTVMPTRENILKAMDWLVSDNRPGDTLFFMYSGHGGQIKDEDGDEADAMDELIFPCDWKSKGYILDDELHQRMVMPIHEGVKLLCFMDCCHSGTGMDLPYASQAKGPKPSKESLFKAQKDKKEKKDKKDKKEKKEKTSKKSKKKGVLKHSKGTTVCFSGCEDAQVSADMSMGGDYTGALTHSFTQVMKRNYGKPPLSYNDLLYAMRDTLQSVQRNIIQTPQLTYNKKDFDLNQPFYF